MVLLENDIFWNFVLFGGTTKVSSLNFNSFTHLGLIVIVSSKHFSLQIQYVTIL